MITTQIELTDEQAKVLEERAASEGRSVSEVIQSIVEGLLVKDTPPDREEVKRRALAAIGRFRSDATDLGVEHDRYLAEACGD
ncbi:MAG TPA: ribbon-helix-helix protein, CopG family [Thermoanaerobaculia bacterium]